MPFMLSLGRQDTPAPVPVLNMGVPCPLQRPMGAAHEATATCIPVGLDLPVADSRKHTMSMPSESGQATSGGRR